MGGSEEIKKAMCGSCPNRCRVQVKVVDGRVVSYEEDKDHPAAKRLAPVVRACPRAQALTEWFYHPTRLNYPLKRLGEKGENKWQRISWGQALDEIAEKLSGIREQYGAEAVAFTDAELPAQPEFRARFFNLFGSPNYIGSAQICFSPTNVMGAALLGFPTNVGGGVRPGATKCILEIGTNPSNASRRLWYNIMEAQKQGAKLIVVDPRRNDSAARADLWLQIRPGTDAALLLGMINVIIQEKLYDHEFVARWCHGFDQLAERVRDYSLDKVSRITWVPAEKVREAAHLYATSKPGVVHHAMGLEQTPGSIAAIHARYILPAITGNLDMRGSELLRGMHPLVVPEAEIELEHMLPPEQKRKMLGADRFKLFSWEAHDLIQENVQRVWGKRIGSGFSCLSHTLIAVRAMLTGKPYPVRALIADGTNALLSLPNMKLVYRALKSLDLSVVMDLYMIPSAQLADYVLPGASWLERPMFWSYDDMLPSVDAAEAVLPAVKQGEYERKAEFEVWRELGLRLGQGEYWPWKTLEEAYDYRLAPLGHSLASFVKEKGGSDSPRGEYQKYEKTGFATPTGKVELYSTILEKLGYDPLPAFKEPFPKHNGEYPLILITGGRNLQYYHSQQRHLNRLRKARPNPTFQMHPSKAAELGIEDGDWVWIESPLGRVKQQCHYFEGIDPRVVHAEHGWWFPEEPGEDPWLHGSWISNINVVTDDNPDLCDEVSGGWVLRAVPCKVHKVQKYGWEKA